MSLLISPLARKLCTARGIAPESLRGSGPRGRIMAADVVEPAASLSRRGHTAMATPALLPTRPAKDGYYVYDAEVNMKALADISKPIAVQCEKLLEQGYSLFDYIVRAVVKACLSCPSWQEAGSPLNVLLFERGGEKLAPISNAAGKSIYQLARETQKAMPLPTPFNPHIVVCDTNTSRELVAARLNISTRPLFAFVARGGTPKDEVHVAENAPNLLLPYTFYASTTLSEAEANGIAARLQTLLVDPVSLLLL